MSKSQIKGNQISDNTLTSDDIADYIDLTTLNVSGSINVVNSGSLCVTGSATISGNVHIGGEVTILGDRFEFVDSNLLTITGSIAVSSGTLSFNGGSSCPIGIVPLNGGNPSTATILNSLVKSSSTIFLTKQSSNFPSGTVSISSKSLGSFNVVSSIQGDTDSVAYFIINPID